MAWEGPDAMGKRKFSLADNIPISLKAGEIVGTPQRRK
jgi:hypothetical protein